MKPKFAQRSYASMHGAPWQLYDFRLRLPSSTQTSMSALKRKILALQQLGWKQPKALKTAPQGGWWLEFWVCSKHSGVGDLGFQVRGFCVPQTVEGRLEAMNYFGPRPRLPQRKPEALNPKPAEILSLLVVAATLSPEPQRSPPNFQDAVEDTSSLDCGFCFCCNHDILRIL